MTTDGRKLDLAPTRHHLRRGQQLPIKPMDSHGGVMCGRLNIPLAGGYNLEGFTVTQGRWDHQIFESKQALCRHIQRLTSPPQFKVQR